MLPLRGLAADGDGGAASDDSTPLSLEAISAIQQQRQQLVQQFSQQWEGASPDERLSLVADFRQQLASLLAPLQPPALTAEQQAQQAAQQQAARLAFEQSLPAGLQQSLAVMQQREQLLQQLAAATDPEGRLALVGQLRQLIAQQAAQDPQGALSADAQAANVAAQAQAQAAFLASLPADQQAVMQAQAQRQQAIQAALQLPPDERVAALRAIQAQAAPESANAFSNSTAQPPPVQP